MGSGRPAMTSNTDRLTSSSFLTKKSSLRLEALANRFRWLAVRLASSMKVKPRTGGSAFGQNCLAAARAPCESSSGLRDCLHTMTTLLQISFGLNRSISRACLVNNASFLTLGSMFQMMALTRSNWLSPMNLRMSLNVWSSENGDKSDGRDHQEQPRHELTDEVCVVPTHRVDPGEVEDAGAEPSLAHVLAGVGPHVVLRASYRDAITAVAGAHWPPGAPADGRAFASPRRADADHAVWLLVAVLVDERELVLHELDQVRGQVLRGRRGCRRADAAPLRGCSDWCYGGRRTRDVSGGQLLVAFFFGLFVSTRDGKHLRCRHHFYEKNMSCHSELITNVFFLFYGQKKSRKNHPIFFCWEIYLSQFCYDIKCDFIYDFA